MARATERSEVTNGAAEVLAASEPYMVRAKLRGTADFLFHRWNCEEIEEKSKAAKNSAAKKTDNLESYVYRTDAGELAIPGEYVRQSIVHAAKFRQDPRSPRKSAMDLYKAGIVTLTNLASVGKEKWDYEDKRRVVIQRAGINRTRPALKTGWEAEFQFLVNTPEYISDADLLDVLTRAGQLVGLGDFRPTFGRFQIVEFGKVGN